MKEHTINFAEIQDFWAQSHGLEDTANRALDDVPWLLSRLIEVEARAMEAEFSQTHTDRNSRDCPICGDYSSLRLEYGHKHGWVRADWEREAEGQLRKET